MGHNFNYDDGRTPNFNASLGFHRLLVHTLMLAFASTVEERARTKQAVEIINEVYGPDVPSPLEREDNHVMLVTASGFRAHLASCYNAHQADALCQMLTAVHRKMTQGVGAENDALLVLNKQGAAVMPNAVVDMHDDGRDIHLHDWRAPRSEASTGRIEVRIAGVNTRGDFREVYPHVYDLRLTCR